MKSFIPFAVSVMVAIASARELAYPMNARRSEKRSYRSLGKREVPQEHSHEKYLTRCNELLRLDNPDEIQDCVFGLLGNDAASTGAGQIDDPDCLHQATADRAFTNAKAAGDIQGQVDALIFQSLERNTGSVGLKSVECTVIPAVNPEIAAIKVHQDPASEDAAAINKAITLELARQIAILGGDPLQALESGTFAPGEIGDPTAAGNTCNELDDPEGCIFTQNLLVPDATEEEILAAVADINNEEEVVEEVVEEEEKVEEEVVEVVDDHLDAAAIEAINRKILQLKLQLAQQQQQQQRGKGRGKGRGNAQGRGNQNVRVIKIVKIVG